MKIRFLDGRGREFKTLVEADLHEADLRETDLRGADLKRADLRWADLHEAYLQGADLQGADLQGADLQGADLKRANLHEADLQEANLREANLRGADLRGADLQGADLRGADLQGANLPAPTVVLLAEWGELSDELTADLMEYDAANRPDRSRFELWAKGGPCPYNGVTVERAANFVQRKELWGRGKLDTPYNLMLRIFAECEVKFS